MREIKFRAWLIEGGRMIEVAGMERTPGGIAVWENACEEMVVLPGAFVLMQYTGLKDKTGREIYEGDILRDSIGMGEVKWIPEHCQFRVRVTYPNHSYIEMDPSDQPLKLLSTEVIGNIHETPELLK